MLLAFVGAARAVAYEDALPARIAPDAPFPRIQQEAPTIESVAPGVMYADYQLLTAVGPLSVHVVSVEPHRADVHLGAVLADDSLESRGETIGSMARRTRAVAGINGDFFDIGNTNRPIGIVVRAGTLVQPPYKRYALAITHDGMPHIAEFSFNGQVEIDQRTMPLDGIDEMPNGGLSLLTPLYGRVRPQDDVTLVKVEPLGDTPPLTRYRVIGAANNLEAQPPGYYVAIGLNDYSFINVPDANAVVTVSGDLAPLGLDSISAAVGGGALILHDGAWYDDGDAPYRVENSRRMPCSGAAIAPNGRLFLVEVDGRQPELSVGVTRPEFAALMRALGATEGLLFDGGGSSTLVARRLGESDADVMNSPSDGRERPVADGILVYSTAPAGPPIRLVARPGALRALPGAEVPLRIAAVDAANHATISGAVVTQVLPPALGEYRDGEFIALRPGSGRIVLRDGNLHGSVPIEIAAAPARTRILPSRPNVDPNATIALSARAYDRDGYALALPPTLRWSASSGVIDARGQFRAASHNARVSVRIGDAAADALVTVGSHDVALAFADHARFTTLPHGGAGSIARDAGCRSCVALSFSFGGTERAAYATADLPLPSGTMGLTFDLHDDGSDARVRVNVRNAINEDTLVQAADLGQPGWRTVAVRFPPDTDAARLISIYVLRPKGIELSEGTIVLRNVRAIVAGR
ncbi:MAG: phosphodiester glycosidase family protein [Candidatus Eremiobacteraeota bacterium]|nr:phosphodiester glycosidase family protein [Candidatus Eremiobacteraeota bacterium]